MTQKSENSATARLQESFSQLQKARIKESNWLKDARKTAFSRFESLGIPTQKNENWRFTPLKAWGKVHFQEQLLPSNHSFQRSQIEQLAQGSWGKNNLVFIDGAYEPSFSSVEGLSGGAIVSSIQTALQSGEQEELQKQIVIQSDRNENHAFAALNLALFTDGAWISIPKNVVVEEPINLIFVATSKQANVMNQTRNIIVAGESSQATIIERYVSLEGAEYFTNTVTEVVVSENAKVEHYKVQEEASEAFHIGQMRAEVERYGNFASLSISLGSRFARNDFDVALRAENCECTLNGFYIARNNQLVDHHTSIDHLKPHCNSFETYKGILDDKGIGIFNGKIFVREDAQKTDAKQSNQTLLLSDDAQLFTKPQLEILADDVKCTHGATTGALDAEAMFYLQSRGIPKENAREILTYAFANELVSQIKLESLRTHLDEVIFTHFRGGERC